MVPVEGMQAVAAGIGVGLGKLVLECVQRRWLVVGRYVVMVVDRYRQEGVQCFSAAPTHPQAKPSICLFSD